MIKKILSYACGVFIGLLIIAPPINYTIPLIVNTFHWLYLVIASGLFGFFAWHQEISAWLKLSVGYLFASCFISQCPASSFNAYVLVVAAIYLLIFLKRCDFNIIIGFIEAAFWLEVVLCGFQIAGADKLLCFDRAFRIDPETMAIVPFSADSPKYVLLGTAMQYMRMSSIFAVMSPFLIFKSRWYLIPLSILCVVSQSSCFAVSLIAGAGIYCFVVFKKYRMRVLMAGVLLVGIYAAFDWGSWRGAIIASNGGRLSSWWAVLQTWVLDTAKMPHPSQELVGTFQWQWFLFGHGMDSFLPLFPIYKHDLNPFPQAHCDWLQILWETGIVGFGLISAYCISLAKKLIVSRYWILLSGAACISTAMFFAFPMRLTQSMFLIVAFLALCEQKLKQKRGLA